MEACLHEGNSDPYPESCFVISVGKALPKCQNSIVFKRAFHSKVVGLKMS